MRPSPGMDLSGGRVLPLSEVCFRLKWHGRVQGVGFRATVRRACSARRVVGWVRNTQEGDVEAMLLGARVDVNAALEAICNEMRDLVSEVEVREDSCPSDRPTSFEIRR